MSNPRPKAPDAVVLTTHVDRRAETVTAYDKQSPEFVHSWASPDLQEIGSGFEAVRDEAGEVVKFRRDILVRRNRKQDEAERRAMEELSINTVKNNWLSSDNNAPELASVDKSLRHVATPRTPPKQGTDNPELTGG